MLAKCKFQNLYKSSSKKDDWNSEKIVSPSQTAFIPGRNIIEGVVVLHETIHEMDRKKMSGAILKIDFEKAYDNVTWDFLQQCLRMKGFSDKSCQWINQFICKGSMRVKVNENVG
jgi:hypothetical protein